MKRAFASFLLSLGIIAPPTQAEDLASIRVSAFEIEDQQRVEEIEKIQAWYRDATDADKDKVNRDFWYLLLMVAAEKQALNSPDSPPISDDALKQALKAMGLKIAHEREVADPVPALDRIWQMDRKRDLLLYGATRGLEPQILQECVVAAGKEVAASGWEQERQFTIYYRVERIESDRLRMEISEDWGDFFGRFSTGAEGFAYSYPFHVPILRSQSSFHGATSSYTLEFLEVRPIASAENANVCRVSYPAGQAPHPGHGERGSPNEGQGKRRGPPAAGAVIGVSPPAESP